MPLALATTGRVFAGVAAGVNQLTRRRRLGAQSRSGAPAVPRKTPFSLGRLHADFVPGVCDGFLFGAGGAVTTLGIGDGTSGKGGESRRPSQVSVADRVVPDL